MSNDQYEGLKQKYIVLKAGTGERVENCFVLRPDKDSAAVAALRAYARFTENKTLANDIINWVGAEENEPLTLDELVDLGVRAESGEKIYVYCTPLNDWAKVFKFGLLFFGTEDYQSWAQIDMDYGKRWLAYRHKPEEN